MKKTLNTRGRFKIQQNVDITVRDKNGDVKRVFQQNKLFTWLLQLGILTPLAPKIPLLFGHWSNHFSISNLVVSAGSAGVASRINGSGAEAAFTSIGFGTGVVAAAAGDTALGTGVTAAGAGDAGVHVLPTASVTASRVTTDVTNDTAQLAGTVAITGTIAITESGVFNANTAGTMIARQVFSAINVVNGDSLTITWKFDVD